MSDNAEQPVQPERAYLPWQSPGPLSHRQFQRDTELCDSQRARPRRRTDGERLSFGEVDSGNSAECFWGVRRGSNLCTNQQGRLEKLGIKNVLQRLSVAELLADNRCGARVEPVLGLGPG